MHLRNSVESLIAEGIYPPGDPTTWRWNCGPLAHGVAALLISRPYLPWGDVEEFADRVMKAVCMGHIVLRSPIDAATLPPRLEADRRAEGNVVD